MKRSLAGAIVLIAAFLSVQAQQPPQQPQMKLEDVQKALSLVDKPVPVPDKYKVGFEAIAAKDTMAILTYLSSDWMQGRETAKPGYDQAADYAASLFKMWGVKPAGDMPAMGFGGRTRPGAAPAAPPERTYFQNITFKQTSEVESTLKTEVAVGPSVKSRLYTAGVDYAGGFGGTAGTITAPVAFVGYGISEPSIGFDELKGLNLKGKIVLILTEAPGKENPQSPFQAKKELKDKYFPQAPAGGPRMGPPGGQQRFSKIAEIQKLGPAAILQVENTGKDVDIYRSLSVVRKPSDDRPIIDRAAGGRLTIAGDTGSGMGGRGGGGVSVTREIANAILEGTGQTIDDLKKKIETTMKPASLDLPGAKVTLATTAKTTLVRSPNVLGMIEGSDPKLKDECFVIGAHFDHLGAFGDYIYNGADDNGSGSVGVLAIAKAMAANPVKPKRTVIFALWTGEEKGLYGSRYYTQYPVIPIEKTVGYLNYDMISRASDPVTLTRSLRQYNVPGAEEMIKKVRADRYASVNLTVDTDFAALTREMNKYVGLDLVLRENPLGVGSGGSDHASFAAVKVPFVYYMAAMTTDYHQTSDSIEKINAELFTKICQMGYLTSFAYADK